MQQKTKVKLYKGYNIKHIHKVYKGVENSLIGMLKLKWIYWWDELFPNCF